MAPKIMMSLASFEISAQLAATKLMTAKPISTAPSMARMAGMRRVEGRSAAEFRIASALAGVIQPRSIQRSMSLFRRWR